MIGRLDIAPLLAEIQQQREARAAARQKHELPADLPSELTEAIPLALGVSKYDSDGWSNLVPCPFGKHDHDDTKPGGAWNRESNTFHCFKCQSKQTYLAIETAAALGIERPRYAPLAPDVDLSRAPDLITLSESASSGEIELYHFPKFPDLLRRFFMGLNQQFEQYEDQTPALICLEAIHEAIRGGDSFPVEEVITRRWITEKRGIKETTARTGLDQLVALGWLTRMEGKAVQFKLLPIAEALANMRQVMTSNHRQKCYPAQVTVTDHETIPPVPADITPGMIALEFPDLTPEQLDQGAKALNEYRAEMYQEFAGERAEAAQRLDHALQRMGAVFSLESLLTAASTTLAKDDPWGNSSDYRASFYRARVQWRLNHGFKTTQQQAAAELGVSPRSLYTLRQKHGIALDEQFDEIPVQAPAAVFEVMPRWAARRDYGNTLVSSSGKKISADRAADRHEVTKWVAAEIKGGNSVTLRVQTGSLERFATAEEKAEMEARAEAQKEQARQRRIIYLDKEREKRARLKLERVEIALQETIAEFDPRWVKEQLDFKPGWELLLEGIALGAVIHQPAKISDIRTESLSYIGKIRRLPPLPHATPFKRRDPGPKSEAEIMWNFPYWQAAVGSL